MALRVIRNAQASNRSADESASMFRCIRTKTSWTASSASTGFPTRRPTNPCNLARSSRQRASSTPLVTGLPSRRNRRSAAPAGGEVGRVTAATRLFCRIAAARLFLRGAPRGNLPHRAGSGEETLEVLGHVREGRLLAPRGTRRPDLGEDSLHDQAGRCFDVPLATVVPHPTVYPAVAAAQLVALRAGTLGQLAGDVATVHPDGRGAHEPERAGLHFGLDQRLADRYAGPHRVEHRPGNFHRRVEGGIARAASGAGGEVEVQEVYLDGPAGRDGSARGRAHFGASFCGASCASGSG